MIPASGAMPLTARACCSATGASTAGGGTELPQPPGPRPPRWPRGENLGNSAPERRGKNPSACLSLRNGAKPESRLPGSENWVPSSEPHGPRALRPPPPRHRCPLSEHPKRNRSTQGCPQGHPNLGQFGAARGCAEKGVEGTKGVHIYTALLRGLGARSVSPPHSAVWGQDAAFQ